MTVISDKTMATASSLERFFAVLVETIRDAKPDYLRRPFTVAEIYQSLIPYRTHRDRLGVEMNGDYEDVLLRLLAGEGGFLQMESDQATDRIQKELRRKNPNSGVYREFAAAEVRLNPARVGESPNGVSETPTSSPPDAPTSPDPVARASPEPAGSAPPAPDEPKEAVAARAPDAEPLTSCPSCGEALPDRAALQFCPFCGTNTRLVPCRACGEELDRSWRFCVACGESAA